MPLKAPLVGWIPRRVQRPRNRAGALHRPRWQLHRCLRSHRSTNLAWLSLAVLAAFENSGSLPARALNNVVPSLAHHRQVATWLRASGPLGVGLGRGTSSGELSLGCPTSLGSGYGYQRRVYPLLSSSLRLQSHERMID